MDFARFWNDPRWRLGVLIAAVVVVVAVVLVVRYPLEPDDDPTPTPSVAAAIPTSAVPRDVPAPADCLVAPRSLESLQALAGTPVANVGSPAAEATPATPLAAVGPADAETIRQINETYRESVACANAGDSARQFAFYSDDYLRRLFVAAQVSPEIVVALLPTPRAAPQEQWTAIRAIGDVQVRDDGRVTALVVTDAPGQATAAGGLPRIVFFVQRDGRWLIDDIVDIVPPGTPTP